MTLQVMTGLLMASALIAGEIYAFDSVGGIMENLVGGGLMRFCHANFCSMVFIVIIAHLRKRM